MPNSDSDEIILSTEETAELFSPANLPPISNIIHNGPSVPKTPDFVSYFDLQLDELRRLADAAEARARVALHDSISAKKNAKIANVFSIISLVIAAISVAIQFFL